MPMDGAVFAGYMYGWAGLSPQPNSNARVSRVEEFIKVLRVWSNLCKCVQHSEALDEFYCLRLSRVRKIFVFSLVTP